jgi:glutaredoxin 3
MSAGAPHVVIYTAELCGFCSAARRLLSDKGVEFQDIDVTGRAAERAELARKAGGRTSVPQIWIGATHIGGCDDLYALERAGRLDAMLQLGQVD